MNILFVTSTNKGFTAPFVEEQAAALRECGCKVEVYGVKGKGIWGYLKNIKSLRQAVKESEADIVHAHYGLCGWLCFMADLRNVVTTYHGSDINNRRSRPFSRVSIRHSRHNIFVSRRLFEGAGKPKRSSIIPCGVDLSRCKVMDKTEAREMMALEKERRYVLFSSAFSNAVKNYPLAKAVIESLDDDNVTLLELANLGREQVVAMMNAADCLLMTSFTEGSPQVVKEAMAVGLPIVSVDVGDVRERVEGVKGCFVAERNQVEELGRMLKDVLSHPARTNGRDKLINDELDNRQIAQRLIKIYTE